MKENDEENFIDAFRLERKKKDKIKTDRFYHILTKLIVSMKS